MAVEDRDSEVWLSASASWCHFQMDATQLWVGILFEHRALVCVCVFSFMYMHHLLAWDPERLEEGIGCPGTGVMDGCEP